MNEAALRHVPLTVITVHEVAVGYWGSAITCPEDHALADRARRLVQDEADKVLAGPAGPGPESVTVEAISGVPAEELITSSILRRQDACRGRHPPRRPSSRDRATAWLREEVPSFR